MRGGLAITVIDPRVAAGMYLRAPRVRARPAEAPEAGLVASLLADRSGERREKAASIVAAWKAGQPVEGGPFAGVCIELREGESVEEVVARFRQAMRERLRRREVR